MVSICCGLTVSPKKIRPNVWYLWMWSDLKIESLQMYSSSQVKMSSYSLEWAFLQWPVSLKKKKRGKSEHRDRYREKNVMWWWRQRLEQCRNPKGLPAATLSWEEERQGHSLETPERAGPCWHLVSDFKLLELLEKCVCVRAQSWPTLCNPVDYSPLGSSVHGILQARILEWVARSFSRGSSWPSDHTHISCTGRRILVRE